MNQNNPIIQNVFQYFQSQVFKIPSDIKAEIVTLPGFAPTHSFLKFSGPLGSTLIDLQKFDKFGLCFFEIKQTESNTQTLLKVSIKNFAKPSASIFAGERDSDESLKSLKTQVSTSTGASSISVSPPFDSNENKGNHTSQQFSMTESRLRGKRSSAFFQLFHSVYKQTVEGLLQGYVLYLELHGVGFRGTLHEKKALTVPNLQSTDSKEFLHTGGLSQKYIEFKLGQSHDIYFSIPNNIQVFMVKPTLIGLYGIDKENVSHTGASIRNLKLPDSYKGKGIRYKDEIIQTKVGKKK